MKFVISTFFKNLSTKLKCHWNLTRITGTLLEDQYTIFIVSSSVLLIMKNVSDKNCREIQNHILHSVTFLRKSCHLWYNAKNVVEPDRTQMAILRIRITCWITEATDTDSEYVMLIAFPLQRRLHERASVFHYTYRDCPVINIEVRTFNTSDKGCVFVFIGFLQICLWSMPQNTPQTRSWLNVSPSFLYALILNLRQDLNYLLCAARKGHNAAFL